MRRLYRPVRQQVETYSPRLANLSKQPRIQRLPDRRHVFPEPRHHVFPDGRHLGEACQRSMGRDAASLQGALSVSARPSREPSSTPGSTVTQPPQPGSLVRLRGGLGRWCDLAVTDLACAGVEARPLPVTSCRSACAPSLSGRQGTQRTAPLSRQTRWYACTSRTRSAPLPPRAGGWTRATRTPFQPMCGTL